MPSAPPFRADRYELGVAGAMLLRLDAAGAARLAPALAKLDPWLRYGTEPARLAAILHTPAGDGQGFAIHVPDQAEPAGAVVVRSPWLAGPYLNLLAVRPGHQGQGLGGAVLAWMEGEARRAGQRNLFLCVSDFNEGAQRRYAKAGFERVADLADLARDGIGEILMRKRLA